MKPLFPQKVAADRNIKPLFEPLETDEELLSELTSDMKILETLETFRDDDLGYSTLKVSESVKNQISELMNSLHDYENVDYLKVRSLFSVLLFLFIQFLIPEFPAISAEKKSPG